MTNYTRVRRILFMTGEVEADKLAAVERTVREAYSGRSLALEDAWNSSGDTAVMARLTDDLPRTDAFIVIAVSSDADALPGACVIRTPRKAPECE